MSQNQIVINQNLYLTVTDNEVFLDTNESTLVNYSIYVYYGQFDSASLIETITWTFREYQGINIEHEQNSSNIYNLSVSGQINSFIGACTVSNNRLNDFPNSISFGQYDQNSDKTEVLFDLTIIEKYLHNNNLDSVNVYIGSRGGESGGELSQNNTHKVIIRGINNGNSVILTCGRQNSWEITSNAELNLEENYYTITAIEADGYVFNNFIFESEGNSYTNYSPYSFVLTEDINIVCNFEESNPNTNPDPNTNDDQLNLIISHNLDEASTIGGYLYINGENGIQTYLLSGLTKLFDYPAYDNSILVVFNVNCNGIKYNSIITNVTNCAKYAVNKEYKDEEDQYVLTFDIKLKQLTEYYNNDEIEISLNFVKDTTGGGGTTQQETYKINYNISPSIIRNYLTNLKNESLAGKLVNVDLSNIPGTYSVDTINIYNGDHRVYHELIDNVIKFYMPETDVNVDLTFTDNSDKYELGNYNEKTYIFEIEYKGKKITLNWPTKIYKYKKKT